MLDVLQITYQVTLLNEDIEAGNEQREKSGSVFLDFSAAYDTRWRRGLKLKRYNIIQDNSDL